MLKAKTFVIFIGPAGSGKSTLVYAYSRWLQEQLGIVTFKVNLDPAAEYIPYKPDFDVRNIVDANKIAEQLGLGPNGALVKAMDMIMQRIDEIIYEIDDASSDFVLVDTPGQMEVFLFRDIAFKLIERLKWISKNIVAVFVGDAEIIKRYEDYVFLSIISIAVQVRLSIDVVPVINKVDITSLNELVGDVISDIKVVSSELRGLGVYGEMLENILNIISLYSKATQVPKISAKYFVGLEELHRIIHEITCACGDLT